MGRFGIYLGNFAPWACPFLPENGVFKPKMAENGSKTPKNLDIFKFYCNVVMPVWFYCINKPFGVAINRSLNIDITHDAGMGRQFKTLVH